MRVGIDNRDAAAGLGAGDEPVGALARIRRISADAVELDRFRGFERTRVFANDQDRLLLAINK